MKKYHLVAIVGILALAANLLVPGLAFGQTQQGQQGTEQINCLLTPVMPSIDQAPTSVTFHAMVSPVTDTDSYDDAAPTGSGVKFAANQMVEVTDTYSGGIFGCAGGLWNVTSTMTSGGGSKGLVGSAHATDRILASDIIQVVPASSQLNTNACSSGTPSALTGGILACNLSSTVRNSFTQTNVPTAAAGDYTASGLFTGASGTKVLSSSVLLMNHTCGTSGQLGEENSHFFAAAPMYIYQGVKAYQPSGTYTGTVTYTLDTSAGTC